MYRYARNDGGFISISAYRMVVVGCSNMAKMWVEQIKQRPDCDIVGLVDIKTEFAQTMAERHGLTCSVYTDVEEAITAAAAYLVLDIIFEMTDGSVFCYRGSWCAEGAPTSWEADWRVTGEKGTALWDGAHAPYAEVVAADGDQAGKFLREFTRVDADVNWGGRSGHAGCMDEMFAALAEGRRAETDCRDNIRSMAMVLGALESAKLGQKVDLTTYYS
ncbi:Gfo/Idh/MocA family oxidoreductase [Paenibacillus roseipurpureus]|uniref:Gfo/Idh/MocA-like oxidoreductase C-terminal domain-containing protein n=1 Tax=Paenibacillus roseopurpureus TaxID=2918901 RepID=A0AA96RID4_9BACL|nr:hypothetical protein [Paenibacillus sp. MBLB1832]WNR42124.1 hypothetical protein MJB10_13355 [Paenibacillus sp. MBLB1832]